MPSPVVNFTAASTPDAVSGSAPYKVSRDTAKDDLTYTWQITFTGTLRYWQERVGGALRTQGTKLRHLGVVCGLGNRCGETGSMPLATTSSPQSSSRTVDIDGYLATDGDYRFGVDALVTVGGPESAAEWTATT
jgi:hypothetical protein